jgi:endonuclease YncB( thermonuclease family)
MGEGLALHNAYQNEQPTQDRLVYRDEEESAKARRVGLWKDAKPVPPWEWRRGQSGEVLTGRS